MTGQLKELIERLEKATGPDPYLDLDISNHVSPDDDATILTSPSYTASIDAALTLVPEGSQWTIEADAAWVERDAASPRDKQEIGG